MTDYELFPIVLMLFSITSALWLIALQLGSIRKELAKKVNE